MPNIFCWLKVSTDLKSSDNFTQRRVYDLCVYFAYGRSYYKRMYDDNNDEIILFIYFLIAIWFRQMYSINPLIDVLTELRKY